MRDLRLPKELQINKPMNARGAVTTCSLVICVGSVWAVFAQRQQIAIVRAGRQHFPITTDEGYAAPTAGQSQQKQSDSTNSEELLRLRSEVTRLNARKRELTGIVEENQRLRTQLENSRTNAAGDSQLPEGYIRKTQAHFAGYSTPENTFQSLLCALRDHDGPMLLQSLTPGAAQRLQARFQDASQETQFFKDMDAMPGLALQNRKEQPDGSVQFEVEIVPGMPKQTMRLQMISGQWKLNAPF